MKPVQTLLNIIAQKKPQRVFSVPAGNKRITAIEQEFILSSSDEHGRSRDKVHLQYVGSSRMLGTQKWHYISIKAASDRFRVPVRTIQQLCHDGRLICQRQGSGENSPWLVAEESIRAYCAAQRT